MKRQNILSLLTICFLCVFTISCNHKDEEKYENRGYVTKFSDFSKIKPGESNQQDVLMTLGSPITSSVFGDEQWIYAGEEVTKETFFEPDLKSYESYVISFNKDGIVKKVEKKDKGSLRDVKISGDRTTASGNSLTLMQQLLGNLGRFNTQDRVGAGGGAGR